MESRETSCIQSNLESSDSKWTNYLPVALTAARLASLPALLVFANRHQNKRWGGMMATLIGIDIIDGILARSTGNQHAIMCQRVLDETADAVTSVVAPISALQLKPEILKEDKIPLMLLATAQATSTLASLIKFGKLPRYHTRAYRLSVGGVGLGLAGRMIGDKLAAGFRPALGLLTLSHIEALGITASLDEHRNKVKSIVEI